MATRNLSHPEAPNNISSRPLPSSREFLIANPVRDPLNFPEAKLLLIRFIEAFCGGISVIGFQNCQGIIPDQILFRSPSSGSSLAIPVTVLLMPQEAAREAIQNKIKASDAKFAKGAA